MGALEVDRNFLDKLRDGDPAAGQFFGSHFGRLLMLKLRLKVRSYDLLEDVRQETLLRTLAAIRKGSVQQPEKLGAYISAVADHVLLELIRDRSRVDDTEVPEVRDSRLDIDRELIDGERVLQVRRTLAELPERQRNIIRLVFLDGIDRAEVCRRFGMTPEQLRVVVHRACSRLRDRLNSKKMGND